MAIESRKKWIPWTTLRSNTASRVGLIREFTADPTRRTDAVVDIDLSALPPTVSKPQLRRTPRPSDDVGAPDDHRTSARA
jgi:hypothetical protein